jgi:hypothetical protein
VATVSQNYQDTLNSVQVALDDPDCEEADSADELELLQHSFRAPFSGSQPDLLQGVASAIYRASRLFYQGTVSIR